MSIYKWKSEATPLSDWQYLPSELTNVLQDFHHPHRAIPKHVYTTINFFMENENYIFVE